MRGIPWKTWRGTVKDSGCLLKEKLNSVSDLTLNLETVVSTKTVYLKTHLLFLALCVATAPRQLTTDQHADTESPRETEALERIPFDFQTLEPNLTPHWNSLCWETCFSLRGNINTCCLLTYVLQSIKMDRKAAKCASLVADANKRFGMKILYFH